MTLTQSNNFAAVSSIRGHVGSSCVSLPFPTLLSLLHLIRGLGNLRANPSHSPRESGVLCPRSPPIRGLRNPSPSPRGRGVRLGCGSPSPSGRSARGCWRASLPSDLRGSQSLDQLGPPRFSSLSSVFVRIARVSVLVHPTRMHPSPQLST